MRYYQYPVGHKLAQAKQSILLGLAEYLPGGTIYFGPGSFIVFTTSKQYPAIGYTTDIPAKTVMFFSNLLQSKKDFP